jgi:predicted nucleotidyltransferase
MNSASVEYLIVGGYAVAYHGYARTTGDIDVWIAINPHNAEKLVHVLQNFGFDVPELSSELFLIRDRIVRMGMPPFRIEILNTISGVSFEECYARRISDVIDGVEIKLINLEDLKINKKASGRPKDIADLQYLP